MLNWDGDWTKTVSFATLGDTREGSDLFLLRPWALCCVVVTEQGWREHGGKELKEGREVIFVAATRIIVMHPS